MPDQKKLEMFEDQYGLHFSFGWMNAFSYFLALFTLLWDGFLFFWYLDAFTSGAPMESFLIPVVHLIAGVFLTYTVLTSFFNKTSIDLIDDELIIKHGPIPWFRGDQKVNINDIQQFYVKEIRKDGQNSSSYNYGVWGIMNDGARLDLTKGVTMTSDYALVVEEKLEAYLEIEDHPVKGAYGNTGDPRIRKAARKAKKSTNRRKKRKEKTEKPLDLDELKNRPKPEIEERKNWDDEDFV